MLMKAITIQGTNNINLGGSPRSSQPTNEEASVGNSHRMTTWAHLLWLSGR